MYKTLLFLTLLLFNAAVAQEGASHGVKLSVPNLLRLQIDDKSQNRGEVDISIRVSEGVFVIEPATTTVQVMANSAWHLSVGYSPASQADAQAQLLWQTDRQRGWQRFTAYPQVLESQNTSGWRTFSVHYGLQTLPTDELYQGTVTFSVTRP